VYPGSIRPGALIGATKLLLANPDLGKTNPPTLFGNWIAIPKVTSTTFWGSITYSPSEYRS